MKALGLGLLLLPFFAWAEPWVPLSDSGFDSVGVLSDTWGKPVYQSRGWKPIGDVAQFKKDGYVLTTLCEDFNGTGTFVRLQRADGKPLGEHDLKEWLFLSFGMDWVKRDLVQKESDGAQVWKMMPYYVRVYPGFQKAEVWSQLFWRDGLKRAEVVQPVVNRVPIK